MENKPIFIAVVGGIAVGKTTILRKLRELFTDCLVIEENVADNTFLEDFYSDMKRWAFHSRISTLSMIANNYLRAYCTPTPKVVILDRCIDELITFAQMHYDKGNMSDREFHVYKELYNSMCQFAPSIDLFVYVNCSVDTSLRRIQTRARKFEQGISREYLIALNDYYSAWLSGIDKEKILNVCTDNGIKTEQLRWDISHKLSL